MTNKVVYEASHKDSVMQVIYNDEQQDPTAPVGVYVNTTGDWSYTVWFPATVILEAAAAVAAAMPVTE